MAFRRRGAFATAAAVIGAVLASAGPAPAAEAPRCWNPAVWARPDIARTFELYCPRAERIELVTQPTASRFEGLVRGESFKFRLTPEADAPQRDSFTIRLTGLGGSQEQDIAITNVPLSQNSPPACEPVSVAERTPGTAPVRLFFFVACDDPDHDGFEINGSGPGTHANPVTEAGGEGGSGNTGWSYLPTISSGQEQTTYHAVDELGARSADAPISVQLGPAVDRLPDCMPNAASYGFAFMPIRTRPGATRRFAVVCKDADGDPLRARVATPPSRGDLTLLATTPASSGFWGNEQWLDATYTPRSTFEGDDPFGVVAGGLRGDGPVAAMGMVSIPPPSNYGGGCGWSPGQTTPGTPVTLELGCRDDEGDPLEIEITVAPEHGEADRPQSATTGRGEQRVKIDYRPEEGFAGVDGLTVSIRDGNGLDMSVDVDIYVRDAQTSHVPVYTIGDPYDWPELRPQGPTWTPSRGQAPPVSPLNQARRALGTRSVRLVKRIGDARVYAARGALPATSRRRALAVTCPVRCSVTSTSTVAGGSAGASKLRVKPGKAGALGLALTRAQRERVRRAGRARASFRLKVARTGRPARSATVRLPLRG
jgi:hypothetical protein